MLKFNSRGYLDMVRGIYVREETYSNEYRTPLTPTGVAQLVKAGFLIYIQSSDRRIFRNLEYEIVGAKITSLPWYNSQFRNFMILGIKELENVERLDAHTHLYFSHCFKGQNCASGILSAFSKSKSKLYDYEFLCDENGKRLIAFGWYAGAVGAALGLHFYTCRDRGSLKPWVSIEDMVGSVATISSSCKIAVLGAEGRCGRGVCSILDRLKINFDRIGKMDSTDSLLNYDLVFNCILLDPEYKKTWFTSDAITERHIVIVDISCDYSKPNNPIPLYTAATSWEQPVLEIGNYSIIAIENLPSLLPRESSEHFSEKLVTLLLDFDKDSSRVWERCIEAFRKAVERNEVHSSLPANTTA